jgi:XTP/dITP diphosphohydrolase
MQIVLATSNPNKVKEIASLLPENLQILSLKDIGHETEIPEDHDNLEDNSLQKAMTIWQEYKFNCMAEDSGLFVEALDGEPGVYSARYAGPQKIDADNIQKVLKNLENQTNRKAYFKTVFTLIIDGVAHQFTGIFNGQITKEPKGEGGFGYDPIFEFRPNTTLAQISLEEKKKISHRSIALKQLIEFVHQL